MTTSFDVIDADLALAILIAEEAREEADKANARAMTPGADGKPGLNGDRGEQGIAGDRGADGKDGRQGDKGDRGEKGDAGLNGADGEAGKPGPRGVAGRAGTEGKPGDQGPRGPDGKSFVWRGAWSHLIKYEIGDAVEHYGSTFVATKPSINLEPPAPGWSVMAKAGKEGPQGPQGFPGRDGINGADGVSGGAADLDSIVVDVSAGQLVFDLANATIVHGS